MYYITYKFNESAIITVTAREIASNLESDKISFTDKSDKVHTLLSSSLISILPAPRRTRRTSN